MSRVRPLSFPALVAFETILSVSLAFPPIHQRGFILSSLLLGLYCYIVQSTTGDPKKDWALGLSITPQLGKALDLLLLAEAEKTIRRNVDSKEDNPKRFSFWRKLCWSFEIVHTPRGVGWNWEIPYVCYTGCKTRRDFLRSRLVRMVLYYLLLDILQYIINCSLIPTSLLAEQQLRFPALVSAWSYAVAMYLQLWMIHTVPALLIVSTGLAEPSSFPYVMGPVGYMDSLRGLWGRTWHQVGRRVITSFGLWLRENVFQVSAGSRASVYIQLCTGFALGGATHAIAGWMAGNRRRLQDETGAVAFFTLQLLGVVLEDAVFETLLRFSVLEQDWRRLSVDIRKKNYGIDKGHALSYFKDAHGTLIYARHYFNNTRRPFRITLAGKEFCVLTSPQDVAAAYKNTSSLSFDGFIYDVSVACGISYSAIEKMWIYPKDGFNAPVPNPEQKCLAQLTRDFHKQQLQPGEHQMLMSQKFQDSIDESLVWSVLKALPKPGYVLSSDDASVEVSLKGWCGDVLLNAATRAFFGEALLEVAPDIFRNFFLFDSNSWMLIYRYPRFLAWDMYQGKDALVDSLTKYFELPKERRPDEAYFVRTFEKALKDLGINTRDIASAVLMVYWVVNANTYKLCFWIFSHLLHDLDLMTRIREETDGAFANGNIDMPWLLDSCPRLNAFFDEVMRITNSSSSVRSVVSDTMIGKSFVRAGMNVLIPYRELHFNQDVFGKTALELDPERFLKNKNLSRNPSYRPFGGGSTYCPGRFIARQEVVAFVGIVLNRFNVMLVGKGGVPQLEEKNPSLGVIGPVLGGDLIIRLEKRR